MIRFVKGLPIAKNVCFRFDTAARSISRMQLRCCSTGDKVTFLQYDKDPAKQYLNEEVQNILKSITRIRLETVFKKHSVPENEVQYKFLTTEELEKEIKAAIERGEKFTQMPPIVQIFKEANKVLSTDVALKDFSTSKFVFTDITYGIKDTKRKVVIRNTDGTLVNAPLAVRKRMNQIYFPLTGRSLGTPSIFEPDNFKRCLDEFKYQFILDRICVQYEPYEEEFHKFSSQTYMHINENYKFDDLRSTRHFGPMAFFLAWHKIIDDCLFDMIKRDYLVDGVQLIALSSKLNNIDYDKAILKKVQEYATVKLAPKIDIEKKSDVQASIEATIGKAKDDFNMDNICLEVISKFVKEHSQKRSQLELAIQTYKEMNDEKRKLYKGLSHAHGIN